MIAAEASLIDRALDANDKSEVNISKLPERCGRAVKAGVSVADRLDVAVKKYDNALSVSNNEKAECSRLANLKIDIANENGTTRHIKVKRIY